jgi:enoyl-CoA hydratase
VTPTTLEVESDDTGLMVITLSRPERLNALSPTLMKELTEQLQGLVHDHQNRVVILTGAGRAFTSGADITPEGFPEEPGSVSRERHWTDIQRLYSDVVVLLRRIPQVVIAAVNGPAVGGGFSIAMASDIRFCDPSAYFMAAQINIGQSVSEMGASYLLPRIVGGRASEILMTGRRVSAEEADRIGLVTGVSDPGQVLALARITAGVLLEKAPLALRMSKEAMHASQGAASFETAITMEDRTQTLCVLSEDLQEAVAVFRDGRQPRLGD